MLEIVMDSASQQSEWTAANAKTYIHGGGMVQVQVAGVHGGATIEMQISNIGNDFDNHADFWSPDLFNSDELDAPGVYRVPVIAGTKVRFQIANTSATTNITLTMRTGFPGA